LLFDVPNGFIGVVNGMRDVAGLKFFVLHILGLIVIPALPSCLAGTGYPGRNVNPDDFKTTIVEGSGIEPEKRQYDPSHLPLMLSPRLPAGQTGGKYSTYFGLKLDTVMWPIMMCYI
jgi:hypothetical protein